MPELSERGKLLRSISPQISQNERERIREKLNSEEPDAVVSTESCRFELHMDVFCYWSEVAEAIRRNQPSRSFVDKPIVLPPEVPTEVFRAFIDYFYTGRLGNLEDLDHSSVAADFLDILPAQAIIDSRRPQAKRHYTRVPVPYKQLTLDLHTVRYVYEHELYLTVEGCQFHRDHLRRDNGIFFLEGTEAGIPNSVCHLRFGPIVYPENSRHNTRDYEIAYNELFDNVFKRNVAALFKQAHSLEQLTILCVPPRESTVQLLKNQLEDFRRLKTGNPELTVHFYEPCWDAMGEDINRELRADDSAAREREDASYRMFQKNVASALFR